MSDIFASSGEQDVTMATATPPYSSEGPTLPILPEVGTTGNHIAAKESALIPQHPSDRKVPADGKRKHCEVEKKIASTVAQRVATIHSSLYQPWTLLPPELLKLLISHARLRSEQNVVTVVFSKNQNVKSGIHKLNTYLGAYRDVCHPIDLPEALQQHDVLIAVSAQGDGTTKLVSIVDMLRRTVIAEKLEDASKVETWWMYTSLTSVEVERKHKNQANKNGSNEDVDALDATQEEEAFEPMDIDVPVNDWSEVAPVKKVPVLTIWMTKKRIPAFKDAFGEQTFTVVRVPEDD